MYDDKYILMKIISDYVLFCCSTYFKRMIAVLLLDSFSQGMTERFSPDNRCKRFIMGLVSSILLTKAIAEPIQELIFWEADLPLPESLKVLPIQEYKFISLNNNQNINLYTVSSTISSG